MASLDVNSGPRPLRFGIMCTGLTFQTWQARCVEELLALQDVRPALLIFPTGEPEILRVIKALPTKRLLFEGYSRVIRPRALRPVDMSSRLRDVPSIRCRVMTRGKFSQYFDPSDIGRIREHDLDFILRFAFGIIRGEILEAARYGVWSFHHDDEMKYRGSPPCFWEIFHGDPVSGAILQRLTNRLDGGIVLRQGYFRTALHSLRQNVDQVLLGSVSWPASVCKDIRTGHAAYLDAPPSRTTAPVFRAPSAGQMLQFLAKVERNSVRRIDGAIRRHEEWCIGIVHQPIASFLEPTDRLQVRWLRFPGDGRFIADPFGVRVDGAVQIVYEDFLYRTAKGVIATVDAEAAGPPSPPNVAIDLPVHSSYPYVVQDRGEIYLIPETHESREVGLYRAVDFPSRWEKLAPILKDVAALDGTVFRHDGRWWLTYTDQDVGKDVHLFVWHAPRLEGPWEPHASNPVKSDVRSSRPAGTPFLHQGVLYRPAQDCSQTYGGGITVNRVVRLTPTEFQEEPVKAIAPLRDSPYPDGIHTISAVGDVTLIDSKRHRFIPSAIPYVLRGDRGGRGA